VPIEPATVPRRWALVKSLISVCGSLLAAVYTLANVLALYYAKAYLIDRPAHGQPAGRADWADGGSTLPVGHARV
jgi:hypothetical protein